MTVERAMQGIAGALVVASVVLAHIHSPLWQLLAVVVGVNLVQSAFTDWCPTMAILARLSVPGRGSAPCHARKSQPPSVPPAPE